MNQQQIIETLQNNQREWGINSIQHQEGSKLCYLSVGFYPYQMNIQMYCMTDDVLPDRTSFPYNVTTILFDGEYACLYACYYSNTMWFCNQLVWRKMDKSFVSKLISIGLMLADKKCLCTIVAKKADMPHVIINYLRDYELAKSVTGSSANDILDNSIIRALEEQHFQIVHTETRLLNVPVERMSILMNYLFGVYKRGWYNIAILPQEEMQKSQPNIAFVNQNILNIHLELFYYPQYICDVELLPYPMTWTTQVPQANIQKMKDLHLSTYKVLSDEI